MGNQRKQTSLLHYHMMNNQMISDHLELDLDDPTNAGLDILVDVQGLERNLFDCNLFLDSDTDTPSVEVCLALNKRPDTEYL